MKAVSHSKEYVTNKNVVAKQTKIQTKTTTSLPLFDQE